MLALPLGVGECLVFVSVLQVSCRMYFDGDFRAVRRFVFRKAASFDAGLCVGRLVF